MTDSIRLWHRLLLRASLSVAHIFSWVFIFQYFFAQSGTLEYATVSVALTYALTQVITVLLTPIAATGLRHGYKYRMIAAILCLAGAYFFLSQSFTVGSFAFGSGIAVFAVLMGVYRAFYWAPYRIAARSATVRIPMWTEYLIAFIPLVAGFVLDAGTNMIYPLLMTAALLAIASILPLLPMRDMQEGYSWGYRETFHQLFVVAHRRTTLSSMMQGIEMSLLLIAWPIIVFVIAGGLYAMLGIVLSAIYVGSLLIRRFTRRVSGMSSPTRALLAASAWIVRLSVVGSIGIVLVDIYYYGGTSAASRGFDMMTLEHTADNTTYVDEYTALKEIGMAIGRIIMALLVSILASNMSVTYTFGIVFLIAAAASAAAIFLSASKKRI